MGTLRLPIAGCTILGLLIIGSLLASSSGQRLALTCAIAAALIVTGLHSPRKMLIGLIIWLAALGLSRRVLTGLTPAPFGADPLLLVGPGILSVLWIISVTARKSRKLSVLSACVLALTTVFATSAINPLQGDALVGYGGILLVVLPMLAFWIGRGLVDDHLLTRLLGAVAGLAAVTSIYGVFQTFRGFPTWDAQWIRSSGYDALSVGGFIRPFSSFSSAAEYATFLGIGLMVFIVAFLCGHRNALVLFCIGMISFAAWLVSVRSVVVLCVVALAIALAASRGFSAWRALLLAGVFVVLLPVAVGRAGISDRAANPASAFASHQVRGLSDPFGSQSTLPEHIHLVAIGLSGALEAPLGTGVGAVTIAASKFSGRVSGTESDLGNAAVIAGFPGLLLYLAVAVLGLRGMYRLAASRRDLLSIGALAILCVSFLQWLNGAQYAVAIIPWLLLGWLDRTSSSLARSEDRRETTNAEAPLVARANPIFR